MMATEMTLEQCKVRLSEGEYKEMDKELRAEDLEKALRLSNNGKAPGVDGIPMNSTKFWRSSFDRANKLTMKFSIYWASSRNFMTTLRNMAL
jgi:hypothetical protein